MSHEAIPSDRGLTRALDGSEAIPHRGPSQILSTAAVESPASHIRNALQIQAHLRNDLHRETGKMLVHTDAVYDGLVAIGRRLTAALQLIERDPRSIAGAAHVRRPVCGDIGSGVVCDDGTVWEPRVDHASGFSVWMEALGPIPGTAADVEQMAALVDQVERRTAALVCPTCNGTNGLIEGGWCVQCGGSGRIPVIDDDARVGGHQ